MLPELSDIHRWRQTPAAIEALRRQAPDYVQRHVAVLETLLPRPIAVGDRAMTDGGYEVTIVAIDDDHAWVKYDSGSRNTWALTDLTRVAS